MKPYADNIVTFRVLLGGYEQVVERFSRASRTRDPVQVFGPMFEALNWAVPLDDLGQRKRIRPLVVYSIPDLPRGKRAAADAEADYERLLASEPARIALAELLVPFRRLADMLEPPRPG